MKKNLIITVLVMIIIGLVVIVEYQTNRVDTAREYIKELEKDFPEHNTNTDAYSNWHNY